MDNMTQQLPEINQEFIDTILCDLIKGQTCMSSSQQTIVEPTPGSIYARDQDSIEAAGKTGPVVFEGEVLRGGCQTGENQYISDNGKLRYSLKDEVLTVTGICTRHQLTITGFKMAEQSLGIRLCAGFGKEVAIVVNTAQSMWDYVVAFKGIAANVAKYLLKSDSGSRFYGKVTLVSTRYLWTQSHGTFYQPEQFAKAAGELDGMGTETRMIFYALVNAMKHFTKDNGLKKEIILITDGLPSDKGQADTMLALTKNLNQNIARNSQGCKDYCVKIHTFALADGLDYLKDLAEATEGSFHRPASVLEFKKQLLKVCNEGEEVFPGDLDNEIHCSKINKMHDDSDAPSATNQC